MNTPTNPNEPTISTNTQTATGTGTANPTLNPPTKQNQMPKQRQVIWLIAIIIAAGVHFGLSRISINPTGPGWKSALHFMLDELPFLLIVLSFKDEAQYKKPVYDMRWLDWMLITAYFGAAAMHLFM